jgi:subtilisin family serine protease
MAQVRLSDPPFVGRTGKGVRIAVVDSGIAPNHPHVGALAAGVNFAGAGESTADLIGHGTAVAAAIREKAPDAELVPVRVFDRELATDAETLARAIRWAAEQKCGLVNLSLGTTNAAHADLLRDAVKFANDARTLVVAAYAVGDEKHLPGSLDRVQVAGVEAAPDFDRDAIELYSPDGGHRVLCRASIYPRPIPGVPRQRNLSGVSFAVANVTGFLARRLEGDDWMTLLQGLYP